VGTVERFAVGFIVVVFLIAVWALAQSIGAQVGAGMSEWLQP
jgi:hypothetical protein